ncbi:hypothethical protein (plasmid) [Ralstonia solanacearum CMR15]|nr:hypothethical protein [Ralstonia solanacearum CMR15]
MSIKGHLLVTGALGNVRRLNDVGLTPQAMAAANVIARPIKGREGRRFFIERLRHQIERRNVTHD